MTVAGTITNTAGGITISSGDLSSANSANASNLINAPGQIITVSNSGTIGNNLLGGALGTVTNNGTINANGGNITVGNFNNGDAVNQYTGSLTVTNGIVKTGNILNNLGSIAVSSGDLSSASTVVANASTLTNAANQTIAVSGSGTIGVTQRLGAVTNNGMFNISGQVNTTGAFNNNSNSTTYIGANIDIGGSAYTFTNAGTVAMLTSATLTGNYTVTGTGTHTVTIDSNNIPSALILSNGAATLAQSSTINVQNTGDALIPNQQKYRIITASTNTPTVANINVLGGNDLLYYTVSTAANTANNNYTDVIITANRQPILGIVEAVGNLAACPVATVLDNLINTGVVTGDLRTALVRLDGLSSEQQISDAVNQLLPEASITADTGFVAPSMVFGTMEERTDLVARAGISNIQTGYAAGSMQANNNLWFKGLGGSINQQQQMSSAGYIANTVGFAFGLDDQFFEDTWLGIGFSSVGTHINGKDVPSKKTHVSSRQVTLYGSYSPEDYYIDGFAALAFSTYKLVRGISYNGLNQTATANYNATQPSAKIAAGYIYERNNGFRIIPNLSLQYSSLTQNAYNETGAGGLSLQNVTNSSLTQLEGGVGVKFALLHKEDDEQTYNPDLHFMVLHDFKSSAQVTTAEFLGGGGNFAIQGVLPEKTTYNVGVGFTFVHQNRLNVTLNYDLRKKNKFIGHAGSIAVKYAF